jgi:hypothetical protein
MLSGGEKSNYTNEQLQFYNYYSNKMHTFIIKITRYYNL